jgi:hypothetical protein
MARGDISATSATIDSSFLIVDPPRRCYLRQRVRQIDSGDSGGQESSDVFFSTGPRQI